MKKLSFFKISLVIIVAGSLWIGFEFLTAQSISKSFVIGSDNSLSFHTELLDSGIGFYKVTFVDFDRNSVFIQVLDPRGNIIEDKKIETKRAVNYFEFNGIGTYTLVATNLSDEDLHLEIEFGDTGELQYPAIVTFFGVVLLWISSYRKLQDHKIAQPEEKIS